MFHQISQENTSKNEEEKQISRVNESLQITTILHHVMAMFGGFMAGYAVLERADILANAQTASLLSLTLALLGHNMTEVLQRFLALAVYVAAILLYVFIKNRTSWNVKQISLGISLGAVLLEYMIPISVSPVIAVLPIFFAMPFQWNAFPGSKGYAASTIFCSNNVRQTTLAFGEYLCDHERKHLEKAFFYLGTLLCFYFGVGCAYLAGRMVPGSSILFGFALLCIAQGCLIIENRSIASSVNYKIYAGKVKSA